MSPSPRLSSAAMSCGVGSPSIGETIANELGEERTAVGRLELGADNVGVHVDGYKRETEDVEIPGFAFSEAERAEHLEEEPDEDRPARPSNNTIRLPCRRHPSHIAITLAGTTSSSSQR